jgi:hypothetical protein
VTSRRTASIRTGADPGAKSRSGPRRGAVLTRVATLGCLVAGILGALLASPPVRAQVACIASIDGRPLTSAASESQAIALDPGAVAVVQGQAATPVSQASVEVRLGPAEVTTVRGTVPQRTAWQTRIPVADIARLGPGLYEIVISSDDCRVQGWIRVAAAAPAGSPLLWVALALGAVGIVVAAWAIHSARGGRARLVAAILGGSAIGGAALLLTHQLGIGSITGLSLVTWLALPGALAGAIQVAVSRAATAPVPDVAGTPPPATEGAPEPPPREPGPPLAPPEPPLAPPEPPLAPGGAGSGPAADPPRTAHARLACPDAVVAGEVFDLTVGLAEFADPDVVSEPLRRPEWSVGAYVLTVQVIAEGFDLAEGDWRRELPVTAESPYPTTTLRLRAARQVEPVKASAIRALFSVSGQPIGLAVRPIAVVREADLLGERPAPTPDPGMDMAIPAAGSAPDLTVRIERAGSESSGRLLLGLLAADPGVAVPDGPTEIDIGAEPERFLRRVIDAMQAAEGRPGLYETLRGIGLTIAEQLPTSFWDVLSAVAARLDGRPPSILILSAEPYVPWELAVIDPALDREAPPFLSAQANVGRWVLGQRRPRLPPPSTLTVGAMSVVSGVYDRPGWARLAEAEAESNALASAYGATPVDATTRDVLELLGGRPNADLIHFAVHGRYDPSGGLDGLVLTDGLALDPLKVRGTMPPGDPFVFLNACQVGGGEQILGDYAGLAEAFLFAGASGVVAPLWSIDDRLAREIAVRFYERTFQGAGPADVLRRERAAFRSSPDITSATYLAYQYFGHPALRLRRVAG